MAHKFTVGRIVELEPRVLRSSAPDSCEIRHLVPATERDPGNTCYRIKSTAEKHERVAAESDLRLSVGALT